MIQKKNSSKKMDIEIQVAVQFVISFLSEKFSPEEVNKFSIEIRKLLAEKFEGHWYPEKPAKGSAYRCLSVDEQLDALLVKAGNVSGLKLSSLSNYLPKKMDLWIDPAEVSYRIGEHGPVTLIYKEGDDCVNSTSQYLAKVLEQIPTVTQKESKPVPTKQFSPRSTHTTPLIPSLQVNASSARRNDQQKYLSASAKSFVSRNGNINLPFLNNHVLPQGINPLLNLEYLQKLQQWPLLAASGYDPLTAQIVQNYLIMQELQRFESRRIALQSHYLKLQNMRWPKKSHHHNHNHRQNQSQSSNNKGLQISA